MWARKKYFPSDARLTHMTASSAVRAADIVLICLSGQSVTKDGYVQEEITLVLCHERHSTSFAARCTKDHF